MRAKWALIFCAATLLASCKEKEDEWKFGNYKDRITDVQTFYAEKKSKTRKGEFAIICSPKKEITYAFTATKWLGSSGVGANIDLRAGSKAPIKQRWYGSAKLVGANEKQMQDILNHIGEEKSLLLRITTDNATDELEFDVGGLASIVARQKKLCS